MRVFSQPAYALISRPYSETSLIVEVFSENHGRLALMAKGARRLKSKYKAALQPFQPLLLSWTGKGEVPTLTSAEIDQADYNLASHQLRGNSLVCAFYCNELLASLLHRHDPHPKLYEVYHNTMLGLSSRESTHSVWEALRRFEQAVLKETGYEVDFLTEADGQTLIEDQAFYRFHAGKGFVRAASADLPSVTGEVVKSLHGVQASGTSTDVNAKAKFLMRDVLAKTLGSKRIISRDLFLSRHHSE